jgi:hypothetical protein
VVSEVVNITIVNGPSNVGTIKMCVYRVELFDDPCGRGYYLDLTKEFKHIYSILPGSIEPNHSIYSVYHPLSDIRITPHNVYAVAFDIMDSNEPIEPYCVFEITVTGK